MEQSRATVVSQTPLTGTDGRELLVVLAEVAPDFTGVPHYHAGDELVYILDGSIVFALDGKPDVALKAGETCHIPAKQLHFGKTASEAVKFLSIQVRELGTPGLRAYPE
jgi:quercetin dioxygenase-like cupin family protein